MFYITLLLLPRKEAGGHLSVRFICMNADLLALRETESPQIKQHNSKLNEKYYLVLLLVDSNCKYRYRSLTIDPH